MDNYTTRPVSAEHNKEILSVLAGAPINANGLAICFDKRPDFFTIPRMKYAAGNYLGLFNNDALKGIGTIGYYDAWVGNRPETIFTLANFYVLPEARGNNFLLRAGMEFSSQIFNNAEIGFSVMMKGNKPAEQHIGNLRYIHLAVSRIIDSLVVKSIIFCFPMSNKPGYRVKRATVENIPDIVRLLQEEHRQRLFGEIITEDNFLKNLKKKQGLKMEDYYIAGNSSGKIVGVCAAWDCLSFRQTRVLRYGRQFWPDLLAYKVLARIFSMASFPSPGECFKELSITDYAVKDRDPAIMHALLTEIYNINRKQQYHFMNWASCGSDPLLKAADGFWYRTIESNIVLMTTRPERLNIPALLPYVDIAFL